MKNVKKKTVNGQTPGSPLRKKIKTIAPVSPAAKVLVERALRSSFSRKPFSLHLSFQDSDGTRKNSGQDLSTTIEAINLTRLEDSAEQSRILRSDWKKGFENSILAASFIPSVDHTNNSNHSPVMTPPRLQKQRKTSKKISIGAFTRVLQSPSIKINKSKSTSGLFSITPERNVHSKRYAGDEDSDEMTPVIERSNPRKTRAGKRASLGMFTRALDSTSLHQYEGSSTDQRKQIYLADSTYESDTNTTSESPTQNDIIAKSKKRYKKRVSTRDFEMAHNSATPNMKASAPSQISNVIALEESPNFQDQEDSEMESPFRKPSHRLRTSYKRASIGVFERAVGSGTQRASPLMKSTKKTSSIFNKENSESESSIQDSPLRKSTRSKKASIGIFERALVNTTQMISPSHLSAKTNEVILEDQENSEAETSIQESPQLKSTRSKKASVGLFERAVGNTTQSTISLNKSAKANRYIHEDSEYSETESSTQVSPQRKSTRSKKASIGAFERAMVNSTQLISLSNKSAERNEVILEEQENSEAETSIQDSPQRKSTRSKKASVGIFERAVSNTTQLTSSLNKPGRMNRSIPEDQGNSEAESSIQDSPQRKSTRSKKASVGIFERAVGNTTQTTSSINKSGRLNRSIHEDQGNSEAESSIQDSPLRKSTRSKKASIGAFERAMVNSTQLISPSNKSAKRNEVILEEQENSEAETSIQDSPQRISTRSKKASVGIFERAVDNTTQSTSSLNKSGRMNRSILEDQGNSEAESSIQDSPQRKSTRSKKASVGIFERAVDNTTQSTSSLNKSGKMNRSILEDQGNSEAESSIQDSPQRKSTRSKKASVGIFERAVDNTTQSTSSLNKSGRMNRSIPEDQGNSEAESSIQDSPPRKSTRSKKASVGIFERALGNTTQTTISLNKSGRMNRSIQEEQENSEAETSIQDSPQRKSPHSKKANIGAFERAMINSTQLISPLNKSAETNEVVLEEQENSEAVTSIQDSPQRKSTRSKKASVGIFERAESSATLSTSSLNKSGRMDRSIHEDQENSESESSIQDSPQRKRIGSKKASIGFFERAMVNTTQLISPSNKSAKTNGVILEEQENSEAETSIQDSPQRKRTRSNEGDVEILKGTVGNITQSTSSLNKSAKANRSIYEDQGNSEAGSSIQDSPQRKRTRSNEGNAELFERTVGNITQTASSLNKSAKANRSIHEDQGISEAESSIQDSPQRKRTRSNEGNAELFERTVGNLTQSASSLNKSAKANRSIHEDQGNSEAESSIQDSPLRKSTRSKKASIGAFERAMVNTTQLISPSKKSAERNEVILEEQENSEAETSIQDSPQLKSTRSIKASIGAFERAVSNTTLSTSSLNKSGRMNIHEDQENSEAESSIQESPQRKSTRSKKPSIGAFERAVRNTTQLISPSNKSVITNEIILEEQENSEEESFNHEFMQHPTTRSLNTASLNLMSKNSSSLGQASASKVSFICEKSVTPEEFSQSLIRAKNLHESHSSLKNATLSRPTVQEFRGTQINAPIDESSSISHKNDEMNARDILNEISIKDFKQALENLSYKDGTVNGDEELGDNDINVLVTNSAKSRKNKRYSLSDFERAMEALSFGDSTTEEVDTDKKYFRPSLMRQHVASSTLNPILEDVQNSKPSESTKNTPRQTHNELTNSASPEKNGNPHSKSLVNKPSTLHPSSTLQMLNQSKSVEDSAILEPPTANVTEQLIKKRYTLSDFQMAMIAVRSPSVQEYSENSSAMIESTKATQDKEITIGRKFVNKFSITDFERAVRVLKVDEVEGSALLPGTRVSILRKSSRSLIIKKTNLSPLRDSERNKEEEIEEEIQKDSQKQKTLIKGVQASLSSSPQINSACTTNSSWTSHTIGRLTIPNFESSNSQKKPTNALHTSEFKSSKTRSLQNTSRTSNSIQMGGKLGNNSINEPVNLASELKLAADAVQKNILPSVYNKTSLSRIVSGSPAKKADLNSRKEISYYTTDDNLSREVSKSSRKSLTPGIHLNNTENLKILPLSIGETSQMLKSSHSLKISRIISSPNRSTFHGNSTRPSLISLVVPEIDVSTLNVKDQCSPSALVPSSEIQHQITESSIHKFTSVPEKNSFSLASSTNVELQHHPNNASSSFGQGANSSKERKIASLKSLVKIHSQTSNRISSNGGDVIDLHIKEHLEKAPSLDEEEAQSLDEEKAPRLDEDEEKAQSLDEDEEEVQSLDEDEKEVQNLDEEKAQSLDEDEEEVQSLDEDEEQAQSLDEEEARSLDEEEAPRLDEDEEEVQSLDEDEKEVQSLDEDEEEAPRLDEDEEEVQSLDEDEKEVQSLDEDEEQAQSLDEEEAQSLDEDEEKARSLYEDEEEAPSLDEGEEKAPSLDEGEEQVQSLDEEEVQSLDEDEEKAQSLDEDEEEVQSLDEDEEKARSLYEEGVLRLLKNGEAQQSEDEEVQSQGINKEDTQRLNEDEEIEQELDENISTPTTKANFSGIFSSASSTRSAVDNLNSIKNNACKNLTETFSKVVRPSLQKNNQQALVNSNDISGVDVLEVRSNDPKSVADAVLNFDSLLKTCKSRSTASSSLGLSSQKSQPKNPKPQNKTRKPLIIDGKEYRQKKYSKQKPWVTNRLYKLMEANFIQKDPLGYKVLVQDFVSDLVEDVSFVMNHKKYSTNVVNRIMKKLNKEGFIESKHDFYNFAAGYLPSSFIYKVFLQNGVGNNDDFYLPLNFKK